MPSVYELRGYTTKRRSRNAPTVVRHRERDGALAWIAAFLNGPNRRVVATEIMTDERGREWRRCVGTFCGSD